MQSVSEHIDLSKPVAIHQLVGDLKNHNRLLYWSNLIACALSFWSLIILGSRSLAVLPITLLFGSFILYRLAMFSHEICHFKRDAVPGFELIWNLACGIPIMLPSHIFRSHLHHHATSTYGTIADPEYPPFGELPELKIHFLLSSIFYPFLIIIRSAIINPWIWLTNFRKIIKLKMAGGSFKKNDSTQYSSPISNRVNHFFDFCTFCWVWTLVSACFIDPYRFVNPVLLMVSCMVIANVLNAYRTVRAHKYQSLGTPMDLISQVQDSTTFSKDSLWHELLCPIGQRYHATHHLLPYLPYHSLREAHKRLLAANWEGKASYLETLTC